MWDRYSEPLTAKVLGFSTAFLNLFFPRHVKCGLCDIELGEDFTWNLCPTCVSGLSPIGSYGCKGCGRFVGAFALHGLCPHCLSEVRWFAGGGSLYGYNDSAQSFVHGLKYHQKPWLAHSMAEQMHPMVRALCDTYDIQCLVPVPIHATRLRERGYNQAQLLAEELSKLTGIPEVTPHLVRTRFTEPQNKLTLPERIENVKGAFSLNADCGEGKVPERILLIDDVLTTGNTLNACAHTLRIGGAVQVTVATYASVAG